MKVLLRNGELQEINFDNREGKEAFWHTSAHVLAQAVKNLYPDTKCAIGPAIENGFYYDFEFSFPFSEEHLCKVEEEMKKEAGKKRKIKGAEEGLNKGDKKESALEKKGNWWGRFFGGRG